MWGKPQPSPTSEKYQELAYREDSVVPMMVPTMMGLGRLVNGPLVTLDTPPLEPWIAMTLNVVAPLKLPGKVPLPWIRTPLHTHVRAF